VIEGHGMPFRAEGSRHRLQTAAAGPGRADPSGSRGFSPLQERKASSSSGCAISHRYSGPLATSRGGDVIGFTEKRGRAALYTGIASSRNESEAIPCFNFAAAKRGRPLREALS
jgi:hypothetical protein